METWIQISKTALVGTARQTPKFPAADDPLHETLASLPVAEKERAALQAAGLVGLWRRAGQKPRSHPAAGPEPCDRDALPRCNRMAEQHLAALLGGQHKEVLSEWLALAAEAGVRVPEQRLPALLDEGRATVAMRESILKVLGKRGQWLAAHNPDWSYVMGASDDTSVWETGSRPARVLFLKRLRTTDPARAREWLAAAWASAPPDDRAVFVPVLEAGLSAADEPFLESALGDRRKEVRKAAAELLARLPASQFSQRMLARLQPLLKFTGGKKPKLEVTLPAAYTKEMERDGVEAKANPGMGEKAGWLAQMIGFVPPSTWLSQWKATAADLLACLKKHDHRKELLWAFQDAAVRHRDAAWADAMVTRAIEDDTPPEPQIAALLLAARKEALLLPLLKTQKDKATDAALVLLDSATHPWSEEFSRAVLAALRRLAVSAANWDWRFRPLLFQFARCLAPGLAAEAAAGWPIKSKSWEDISPMVNDFLALIQFRHDLREALTRGVKRET